MDEKTIVPIVAKVGSLWNCSAGRVHRREMRIGCIGIGCQYGLVGHVGLSVGVSFDQTLCLMISGVVFIV